MIIFGGGDGNGLPRYGVRVTTSRRRHRVPGRALRPAIGVAIALALVSSATACSNQDDPEVPVVPTPSSSDPSGDGSGGSPSPSVAAAVPEECTDLVSAARLAQIVQVPITGDSRRVYNDDFLPDSGRTGRLTCSYGLPVVAPGATPPPTPAPPAIEIAVSSYTDAEIAAGRIESTVEAAQAGGGQVSAQPVGGRDGFILADTEDITIVVADGVLTYVATMRRGFVPPAAEPVVLLGLASAMLGVPSPTPTTPAQPG